MTTAPFAYDVFVSHAPQDADWVRTALVPAFEQAGIRVRTPEHFALGLPRIVEAERGVSTSRRTLLLLSPEYLATTWLQVDAVLVTTHGLHTGT